MGDDNNGEEKNGIGQNIGKSINQEIKKILHKRKKTNEVVKIIMHVIKTVAMPVIMLLLKILAIVILVAAIVSFIAGIFSNDNDDDDDKDLQPVVEEQTGENLVNSNFTEDKIKEFIEKYEGPNNNSKYDDLKNDLLCNAATILGWQNKYNCCAGIIITITIEEITKADENYMIENYDEVTYPKESDEEETYEEDNNVEETYEEDTDQEEADEEKPAKEEINPEDSQVLKFINGISQTMDEAGFKPDENADYKEIINSIAKFYVEDDGTRNEWANNILTKFSETMEKQK